MSEQLSNLGAGENAGTTFVKPKSSGDITFISAKKLYDEGINGVILEGRFLEATENNFNENLKDYKFETIGGELIVINGTGVLKREMQNVVVGTLVQVIYNGKKVLGGKGKSAGKEAHMFEVLVDESSLEGETA